MKTWILREAGLVSVRSDGNFRYYRAERETLRGLQGLIDAEGSKWIPERPHAEPSSVTHATEIAVHVTVELECDRDLAFSAFTDPAMFSEWLGVPVTLDHGRFAATLEWGTRIRGQFEVLVPPELIAIRWDFDDDVIPLPGRELTAYLRFTHTDSGSTIEVHQLVTTAEQADFMQLAWGLVFGRLATGIHQAG